MALEDLGALLEQHANKGVVDPEANRPTIMVVDDDARVLSALDAILSNDYRVRSYGSAGEAVAALDDNIWVVVLDVKMKGRDGFWACDEIHRKNAHLPVIFYSAYQDAKGAFAVINDHQPFGYVSKGSPPGVLLDLIERATRYFKMIVESRRVIADLQRIQSSMRKLKGGRAT